MFESVLFFLILAAASWLAVGLIHRLAERHRLVDIPNARSSHTQPTPRGGGLAVAGVTLTVWSIQETLTGTAPPLAVLTCALGAALVAAVGLLDDLLSLPRSARFAAHSGAALLAVCGLGYWHAVTVPWIGTLWLGWLGLPLTCLWIVGLTNAYNFMDGIDGIAGGQAVVAGLGWAVLGGSWGEVAVSNLGLFLAATSLGFLWHNWSPARIFMGDVGSTFLGYAFAVLPLLARDLLNPARQGGQAFFSGVLLLWPFLFDSSFTLVRRLGKGENILAAHRSHLYQRLVLAGHGHRFVTSLYVALASAGALLALGWEYAGPGFEPWVAFTIPLLGLALWCFVAVQERRAAPRAAHPHSSSAQISGHDECAGASWEPVAGP